MTSKIPIIISYLIILCACSSKTEYKQIINNNSTHKLKITYPEELDKQMVILEPNSSFIIGRRHERGGYQRYQNCPMLFESITLNSKDFEISFDIRNSDYWYFNLTHKGGLLDEKCECFLLLNDSSIRNQ